MKTIRVVSIILISFLFSTMKGTAQVDSVKIITSSLCSTCKEAIEHNLSFEKGVKSAVVDIDTRVLSVTYNSKKTNPEKIRIAVTKIGYDADSLKADQKAFNKLPDCCKDPDAHH
jgi:copper chaperone CopZ